MRRTGVGLGLRCGLVALGMLASACGSGRDREAIIRSSGWFSYWYSTGQADSVVALFAPDGRWIAPDNPTISGPEAIRERVRGLERLGARVELTVESLDIQDSLALEHGRYLMEFAPPGGLVLHDVGRYVTRWRRMEGRWRMVEHQATTQRAPAPDQDTPTPGGP